MGFYHFLVVKTFVHRITVCKHSDFGEKSLYIMLLLHQSVNKYAKCGTFSTISTPLYAITSGKTHGHYTSLERADSPRHKLTHLSCFVLVVSLKMTPNLTHCASFADAN